MPPSLPFSPRIAAAARAAGRRPGGGPAHRGQQDLRRARHSPGARRRPAGVRREPRAGSQGQVAGPADRLSRSRTPPDRPAPVQQGGEAVALFDAIHTVDRPKIAAGAGGRNEEAGPDAAALRSGEHRPRAAEGGHRPGGGGCFPARLPGGPWPRHCGPHVHSPGGGRSPAPFRPAARDCGRATVSTGFPWA